MSHAEGVGRMSDNGLMAISDSSVVDIRPIAGEDAAAAARLSAELGYPADVETMRARIAHLSGLADHRVFVACVGGEVIGWLHVSASLHLQSEPRAEIGGLVVTAGARSSGVGAMLVRRAEQWAIEQGFDAILVRSQIMREAAHRFYLREGYERTKTSAVFTKTFRS
jgi:GNAT superfamily N-acetyltransferase